MDGHGPSPSADAVDDATTAIVGSRTDELTGIAGRPTFFTQAQAVFAAAIALDAECTAVLVDLDRLDHVNDTYGHHAGSELIRETAATLAAIANDGDVVGRIGGDELALLRPDADRPVHALRAEVLDRLGSACRSDRPFGLAVSVGVAIARPSEAGSLDALLARADDAMYIAKRAGGGRHGPPHVRRAPRD